MTIPENIQEKIKAEIEKYLERLRISSASIDKLRDVHRSLGFKTWAEFAYHLRDEELEAKDKEIARLKALLKFELTNHTSNKKHVNEIWAQYKTENNL